MRTFIASVLALAMMCFCGCSYGYGISSSSEESYWMRGETLAGGGSAAESEALRLLSRLQINSGLNYRVTYSQDYTRLKPGQVSCRLAEEALIDPFDASGSPFILMGFGAATEGSLSINADEATCNLTAPLEDEQDALELTGSFSRSEAQTTIDRLRKRPRNYQGIQTSEESFDVEWRIRGTLGGEAVDFVATQQMRVQRMIYSTPI